MTNGFNAAYTYILGVVNMVKNNMIFQVGGLLIILKYAFIWLNKIKRKLIG